MICIECPNKTTPECNHYVSLFLAGGITGCGDWQQRVIHELDDEPIVLLNPRRKDYDINDPTMEEEQIEWEHGEMSFCDAILFWFPPDTLCPITLFELGSFLPTQAIKSYFERPIFLGVHPDYKRITDIQIQTKLRRLDVYPNIVDSLEALISQVKAWI